MPKYELHIERAAVRGLRNLDRQVQRQVDEAIQSLADDPRPQGAKALTGPLSGHTRLVVTGRGGHYRVLYRIDDKAGIVTVVNVAPREGAYD